MIQKTLFSQHEELCPLCQQKLVIRSGPHGPFKGCSAYPACEFIQPLKAVQSPQTIKVLPGQYCPDCNGELVLRQGKFGMFIGCSHYPQCEHIQYIDKPNETAITCPQCKKGTLLQRRSRFGKTFYACDRYPQCQLTLNAPPIIGVCTECGYPLLIEKKSRRYCANKLCGKVVEENDDEFNANSSKA